MMKSILLAMALVAGTGLQLDAQSFWIDGPDSRVPADMGRGISDWQAHYQFAAQPNNAPSTVGFVGDRFNDLRARLSRGTYARVYADVTYLIASYGLKYAGWVNGGDPNAPQDDGNRALLNWQAHFDYVNASPGYNVASKLIADRLYTLRSVLSPLDYARCYADVSILLVNFDRMR